ncbi:DUF5682 family protein [Kitasatospora sp. CM 4170]|uniref:DUF5682 family protein n=1 Tax=Kitasatospora aburaviensis TaxID=67265 RepID=A0ABW1F9R5_9ACTN|nr:DUF5682 family protein [Kitasatospora sp. CM 4170]WNM46182.1 DUF5682 family protein [Kitasatospora sp. CM 4170]
MSAEVTLLGVRHHGPGSARAVAAALESLRPDAVLIEGPPEADPIVALAAGKDMVPPVALLAHAVDDPARAAFWPYAEFSPEWVAIRYGLDAEVPVRFIDLPAAYGLAPDPAGDATAEDDAAADDADGDRPGDPIALLAEAAGHDDPERWWEDVIEHRAPGADPLAPFAAVAEAMTALREAGVAGSAARRDDLREAYMRQQIRAAKRAGHRRIAVVCGAFHVPALAVLPTVAHDRALLAGLPKKVRTDITWVPWTHRRLSQLSGYGAGIVSPGWYHHLFAEPGDPLPKWLTRAAELLRAEDHPVSSAHVIEAVRLARTLAVMRGRPLAGLTETLDAVRSVMCDGSDVALELVRDRLVIGDALGEVPDGVPAVPLQRDLARLQRSLRLKPEAEPRELDLDLRKENDAARSRLLHRLRLLGIDWGVPARSAVNSTGTFRESWRLCWQPEFAVRIVEAAQWGTTVEDAAAGKAVGAARAAVELAELTALVETCLLAGLPGALPAVMRVLADCAALDTDVARLAGALPALVRALRYGDVRGTDGGALGEVATGLADRICVGLPPACTGLDADGAAAMRGHLDEVHGAVGLLDADGADGLADRWAGTLGSLARREPTGGPADGVPGLLRGRAVRLLLDDGRLDSAEAGRRMGLVLSAASAPADAAGWVEGFLTGGGALLLHDPRLLGLLDAWLTAVPAEVFTDVLPLLRRTFAGLEAGVRNTVGSRVAAGPLDGEPAEAGEPGPALDRPRADAAVPVVALLLGLPGPTPHPGGSVRIPRQASGRDT